MASRATAPGHPVAARMLSRVAGVTALMLIAAGAAQAMSVVVVTRRRRRHHPASSCAGVVVLLRHAAQLLERPAAGLPLLRRSAGSVRLGQRVALLGAGHPLRRVLEAEHRAVAPSPPDRAGTTADAHLAARLAGLRLAGVALGTVLALGTVALAGRLAAVVAAPLLVASALLPDAWLGIAAHRAQAGLRDDLPAALDVLALGAQAGLPLEPVIALAALGCGEPLASILARAGARAASGQAAAAALRAEAEATGAERLLGAAAVVERQHRLGMPLAPPLLALADAARSDRHTAALTRAARAVPLAGALTALLIAPASVVALAVSVVGGVISGGAL